MHRRSCIELGANAYRNPLREPCGALAEIGGGGFTALGQKSWHPGGAMTTHIDGYTTTPMKRIWVALVSRVRAKSGASYHSFLLPSVADAADGSWYSDAHPYVGFPAFSEAMFRRSALQ